MARYDPYSLVPEVVHNLARAVTSPSVSPWLRSAGDFWFLSNTRGDSTQRQFATRPMPTRAVMRLVFEAEKSRRSAYHGAEDLLDAQIELRGKAAKSNPTLHHYFSNRWPGRDYDQRAAGQLILEAELYGAKTPEEIVANVAAMDETIRERVRSVPEGIRDRLATRTEDFPRNDEAGIRLLKAAQFCKDGFRLGDDVTAGGPTGLFD